MGLFKLRQEPAVGFGTVNTTIMRDGKIVFDESNVIAFDRRGDEVTTAGTRARGIYEEGHEYTRSVRPLRDGVIADFDAAGRTIRGTVKQANKKSHSLSFPSLRIVVNVPLGSAEMEIHAVRDSNEYTGGYDVYMPYESVAVAIGISIDVPAPEGNMVVDIGGGTIEMAVISPGSISPKQSMRVAGDEFIHDIMGHMCQRYNVCVGECTVGQIKVEVGNALTELDSVPEDFIVTSVDLMDSLLRQVSISYQGIVQCPDKSTAEIESAVLKAFESMSPELCTGVIQGGISLTGDGTLLRGLAERLTCHFATQLNVPEDPLRVVATDADKALKNVDSYNFLIH